MDQKKNVFWMLQNRIVTKQNPFLSRKTPSLLGVVYLRSLLLVTRKNDNNLEKGKKEHKLKCNESVESYWIVITVRTFRPSQWLGPFYTFSTCDPLPHIDRVATFKNQCSPLKPSFQPWIAYCPLYQSCNPYFLHGKHNFPLNVPKPILSIRIIKEYRLTKKY